MRFLLLVALLGSSAALAAAKELPLDETWVELPVRADTHAVVVVPEQPVVPPPLTPAQEELKARTVPPTGLPPPPITIDTRSPAPGVQAQAVVRPPERINDTSLFGARALDRGRWAVGGFAGFPTLAIRAQRGLFDRFDLGLGFESFYGMMNEGQLHARYQLTSGDFEAAIVGMGSGAHFVLRPQQDPIGARWMTGHRNWNGAGGIVISHRPSSAHAPRLFMDARVLVGFDTQPYQKTPLSGVPNAVVAGWNVPLRFGGELPVSSTSSFLVSLGFDIHGRTDQDSLFMPTLAIGGVLGI